VSGAEAKSGRLVGCGRAHYNRQLVYTLRFMTRAEYSKDGWKETL
jgi:hypothetical protein